MKIKKEKMLECILEIHINFQTVQLVNTLIVCYHNQQSILSIRQCFEQKVLF